MPIPSAIYYSEDCRTNSIAIRTVESFGNLMEYSHWHDHFEILLIHEGHYTVINNAAAVSGTTPALFIHRPFSLHQGQADFGYNYRRTILAFTRDVAKKISDTWMDMSLFNNSSMVYLQPTAKEFAQFVYIAEQIEQNWGDPVTQELYTALILRQIVRIYNDGRVTATDEGSHYIQDVLQTISANLSAPLTIHELAKQYDIGITKLQHDLHAVIGTTYKKYLTALRQTRAREMLSSGASIINTSLEVGYSSEAHFIKAFREYWGITPGKFIKTIHVPSL